MMKNIIQRLVVEITPCKLVNRGSWLLMIDLSTPYNLRIFS